MTAVFWLLIILLAVLALWGHIRGTLGAAMNELAGSSSSTGGGLSAPTLTESPVSGSGPFGITGVVASHLAPAQYWQGPNAPDLGLVPDLVGEWNYVFAPGTREPIYLPQGGQGWSLERQGMQAGLGGYEVWRNTEGAVLAFLHLSSLWDPTTGTAGPIGQTGWPTSPEFGAGTAGPSNAHLAVIYNRAGQPYVSP